MQSESIEFMTKSKFGKLVDSVVKEKRVSHMDAVLLLCEKYGIDPSECKKYISNVVKSKIEAEAMSLNYLPRGNELPV